MSRTQSHSLPCQPAPAAARGWEILPCFSQKVARPKGDSEGGARPPARRSDLREDHSERERESTSSLLTPQDIRSSGTAIPTSLPSPFLVPSTLAAREKKDSVEGSPLGSAWPPRHRPPLGHWVQGNGPGLPLPDQAVRLFSCTAPSETPVTLLSSTKYAEAIRTPPPGPRWCHPARGQNCTHPERSACSRAPCGAGPHEGLRSRPLLHRTGQQESPPGGTPESPAKQSSVQLLLFVAPLLPPPGSPPRSSEDAEDRFLGSLPALPGLHT